MNKLTALFGVLVLTGCDPVKIPSDIKNDRQPMRIVSLDYCSDQYVLKLLDRERILAVSPDAVKDFSYMRQTAKGIPSVRSTAENVLILQPDLIIRSYGGGPNAEAFFESAGVPVITLGWASDINGIMRVMRETSLALGEAERGEAVIADMTSRIAALNVSEKSRDALYMTPTGVTTGEGSLIHEMMITAGLRNFQKKPGWHPLPLERLAYEKPDMIAAAFFDSNVNKVDAWGSANHPVAHRQMKNLPTVSLQGAWTSCGGWFLMDAIETLAANPTTEPSHEL